MDLPELNVPRTWRTISQMLTVLDVQYPEPATPVSDLQAWIEWWWPVFHATRGLTPELIAKMRTEGWWPPHVPRQSGVPDVVAEATAGQLYWISRRRIDDRSRAIHRAISIELQADANLVDKAMERARLLVADHQASGVNDSPCRHWIRILGYPMEHLVETMSFDSERMDELRKFSPFVGILPKESRNLIFQAFSPPTAADLMTTNIQTDRADSRLVWL